MLGAHTKASKVLRAMPAENHCCYRLEAAAKNLPASLSPREKKEIKGK